MRLPDTEHPVTSIFTRTDGIWLQTVGGPLHRLDGDRLVPFPAANAEVTAIGEFEGKLWLGTTDGLYQVPQSARIEGVSKTIRSIEKFQDAIWAAGEGGVFRVSGEAKPHHFATGVGMRTLQIVGETVVGNRRTVASLCRHTASARAGVPDR